MAVNNRTVAGYAQDEDIAAWQADWSLPPDVLDEVVRRAVGAAVARDERILDGHGNEVLRKCSRAVNRWEAHGSQLIATCQAIRDAEAAVAPSRL